MLFLQLLIFFQLCPNCFWMFPVTDQTKVEFLEFWNFRILILSALLDGTRVSTWLMPQQFSANFVSLVAAIRSSGIVTLFVKFRPKCLQMRLWQTLNSQYQSHLIFYWVVLIKVTKVFLNFHKLPYFRSTFPWKPKHVLYLSHISMTSLYFSNKCCCKQTP